MIAAAALTLLGACRAKPSEAQPKVAVAPAPVTKATATPAPATGSMQASVLKNPIAYIPPQCFTKTRSEGTRAKNPCYACHTRSEAPNYVNDDDLQVSLKLPVPGSKNPWTNLFSPAIARAPAMSHEAILSYVRQSNYFDADGGIALARALSAPPAAWDANGNGRWDGVVPDVAFAFDDHGFDHRADGSLSGWRAFAYYPFVGTFFPTNGSADDVLIRLDPALHEDEAGRSDGTVYAVNLAIVEALITKGDVAIDPVDEAALHVDLDLDGHLDRATRVAFDDARDGRGGTRMRYVGRARLLEDSGQFPIAPGLFPLGTEFFHTVRYLDVGADGVVTMAPRMKEVRYAHKAAWMTYESARSHVAYEAKAQDRNPQHTHGVEWFHENGIGNELGWYYQGFIEAADGTLRPQSLEESASCGGCHGGIGATTDGIFSFARKLRGDAPARGWFHWSQHGLSGLAEPKRRDGQYEYTLYLLEAGAGDEFRGNTEVLARFFDPQGGLRREPVSRLHKDIGRLLLPSAARALDLDRAYRAVVLEQSFDRGRDSVLAPTANVEPTPTIGAKTGVERPVVAARLAL